MLCKIMSNCHVIGGNWTISIQNEKSFHNSIENVKIVSKDKTNSNKCLPG